MNEPFDPQAAQPPNFPPPGSADSPGAAPQTGVPAYGAPPPMGAPPVETPGIEVPAYGAPPPTSGGHAHGADTAQQGTLAGFGSRLGASLLDGFFASLILAIVAAGLGFLINSRWETKFEPCKANPETTICEFPTDATLSMLGLAFAVFVLAIVLIGVLYHARMIAKTGQTPGRRILGIKVVSAATGHPPAFGRAILRWVFAGFSGLPCGLGYLWMLWDSRNQTWHDKVAGTVVVQA